MDISYFDPYNPWHNFLKTIIPIIITPKRRDLYPPTIIYSYKKVCFFKKRGGIYDLHINKTPELIIKIYFYCTPILKLRISATSCLSDTLRIGAGPLCQVTTYSHKTSVFGACSIRNPHPLTVNGLNR